MNNVYVELKEPEPSENKDNFLLYSNFSSAIFYKFKKSGKKVKLGEISFYRCQTKISKKISISNSTRYSQDAKIAFENIESNLKKGDIYIDNLYVRKSKRGQGYGEYMVSWIENEANKHIFLNIPLAETSFSGKRWESLPAFYDHSLSNMELTKRTWNTLLFERKNELSSI